MRSRSFRLTYLLRSTGFFLGVSFSPVHSPLYRSCSPILKPRTKRRCNIVRDLRKVFPEIVCVITFWSGSSRATVTKIRILLAVPRCHGGQYPEQKGKTKSRIKAVDGKENKGSNWRNSMYVCLARLFLQGMINELKTIGPEISTSINLLISLSVSLSHIVTVTCCANWCFSNENERTIYFSRQIQTTRKLRPSFNRKRKQLFSFELT